MRTMKDLKPYLAAMGLGISTLQVACAGFGTTTPISNPEIRETERSAETFAADERYAQADAQARSQDWSRLTREGREHMMLGRRSQAEQSFISAYLIATQFRHSDVRRRVSFGNLERIARSYRSARYDTSAARVLQFIADETREIGEAQYPGISDLLAELGDIQQAQGWLEHAEASYQRALDLKTDRNGANSTELIPIYQNLGSINIALNRVPEALRSAEKRLRLAAFHYNPTDRQVLNARLQLAVALTANEQRPEAEAEYKIAVAGYRSVDSGGLELAIVQNDLASLYLEMERLEEAYPLIEEALVILEQLELTGIAKASLLDTKAQILAAQGRAEAADTIFANVLSESTEAPTDAKIPLFESFEAFLLDQNRGAEASEIRSRIEKMSGEVATDPSRARVPGQAQHDTAVSGTAIAQRSLDSPPLSAEVAAPSPSPSASASSAPASEPSADPTPTSATRAAWDDDTSDLYSAPPE